MRGLHGIGAYLDTLDRQRLRITDALAYELSDDGARRENYHQLAAESVAWDPPGPVRELWQRFTREAHRACAEAKAATEALPSHLGQHWLDKLDAPQKLHDELLEAAIDGHEQFRPLSTDLCNHHAVQTSNARQERAALDQIEDGQAFHNADFTMVKWFGTEHQFALGVQSAAVGALWTEWEKTGLGLHQQTICEAIDEKRDSFRMDTAFRKHPAWGTMIQRCGDGRYKLVRPETCQCSATPSTPSKSQERAGITS